MKRNHLSPLHRVCLLSKYPAKFTFNGFPVDSNLNKRRRGGSDTEDAVSGLESNHSDQEDGQEEGDDDEEDFKAPKSKPKVASTARKSKAKTRGPSPAKKPRMTKTAVPKPPRKPRKGKAGADAFDSNNISKDTKITADNPLFSACTRITFIHVY